jgi:hypothetical protein
MTLDSLRACFACFEPIPFSLGTIQRFPNEVLYLAPEPDESFRQLTLSIWNLFPETPPYGGKWPDIIPHLSVAQLANGQQLAAIAADFAMASQRKLPIDKVFAFDDIGKAFEHMEANKHLGKIVVTL